MKIFRIALPVLFLLILASVAFPDPYKFEPQVSFIGEGLGGEAFTGNFDEDEWPDLILMEPGFNDHAGRIHVYLNANDFAAGQYDMDLFHGDITIAGEPDDRVGQRGAVCDFNGDSYTDIIINRTYWGGRTERIFVFYGGGNWPPGSVITDLEGEADVVIIPNDENEELFRYPYMCGDINGDEYEDILAGAFPVAVFGGDYPSGTTLDLTATPPVVYFTGMLAATLYTRFLSDINNDGQNDFLFCDHDLMGTIRIWFGFEDYSEPRVIDIEATPPDVYEEGPYWNAYYRLQDVGDWNGDGVVDLLCSQVWDDEENLNIYRINLGEEGMEPGHLFDVQFSVMTHYPLLFNDMNGDGQLDLTQRAEDFYWDRTQFPQTGNWNIWNYEPQGIYDGSAYKGTILPCNLDNDGQKDVIFYTLYGDLEIYFTSSRPNDDDDDTGDDDTGPDDDDDTGLDDDDNDTGPDDDDDTGPDDDDDTGPDDDDDDIGPDDDDDDDDDDDGGCCG